MIVMYYTNDDVKDLNVIPDIIKTTQDKVIIHTKKPTLAFIKENSIEFIVSDRPRYLITKDIIDYLPKKIINMHPSYLPYNRGYNPNYWAIKESTPYGVTLHYIDIGIDTGDVIAQTRFSYSMEDTLHTTYERARRYMVDLFKSSWDEVRVCKSSSFKQDHTLATLHYKADFDTVYKKLTNGWDTKLKELP